MSDGAEHVLEPRFTYYGYRFVKIEGFPLSSLRTSPAWCCTLTLKRLVPSPQATSW